MALGRGDLKSNEYLAELLYEGVKGWSGKMDGKLWISGIRL